jgi:tellurite resistance protein
MSDVVSDRRKALEEAFFARENEALRQRLKANDASRRRKDALAAASGITDDTVLETLAAQDIGSETLAALALVPLVAVAWADGTIDDKERGTVFARAVELGVAPGDVSHSLFERWLTERPPQALVTAWKTYVRVFAARLAPDDMRAFKAEVLNRARHVAEAAGGFLGLGSKVSPPEQKVLDELAAAFPA